MSYIIKETSYYYNNAGVTEPITHPYGGLLEFDTVEDAVNCLTSEYDGYEGFGATINADGVTFSPEMRELPHNCYSAPDYRIVNKASGRDNKAIRAAIAKTVKGE